jgi:hypothetical protein
MTPGYVKQLITMLTDLGIAVPANIRNDQRATIHLLEAIQTAVNSDQAKNATGNAVAADVMKDKTFSTAAGIGLVGTYVPLDTSGATATAADIADGKTACIDGVMVEGTYTLAGATADADATAADIAAGKTAYVNGVKIVGEHV